ncbi:MAG: hypothetical protein ABID64_03805 [Nitrospirota bacterium]
MAKKTSMIRKVYLYLVTAITIIVLLIGFIGLINLLLKEYVLDVKGYQETERYWECEEPVDMYMKEEMAMSDPVAVPVVTEEVGMTDEEMDECIAETREQREMQRMNDLKRDLAQYLAMILVALPLYLYHWGVIKKENE